MEDRNREGDHGSAPRLCIVSRDRMLRWPELMAAFRQTLNPDDELKIIVDRRHRPSASETSSAPVERLAAERRRHQHVDLALRVDGFVIVPGRATRRMAPHAQTSSPPIELEAPGDAGPRSVDARLRGARRPGFPQRRIPAPHDRRSRIPPDRDDAFDDDDIEPRPREPRHRWSRWTWVLTGLIGVTALLTLVVVGQMIDAFKGRLQRLRPSFVTRPLADTPPVDQSSETRTPDPTVEPTLPELPPRRPPNPPAPTERPAPAMPRVELIGGGPAATSGAGGHYVVRILDTGGRQPLLGVEASLVGRTTEGVRLSVPLDPGREPGTYQATVPNDGVLRDLRVRIVTGDSRFEISVQP